MKKLILLLSLCLLGSFAFAMTPVEFATNEGANKNLVSELDDACQQAKNYYHCFGIGLAISKAESDLGNAGNLGHGYFGRMASRDKSAYGFVKAYNKYYYKVDKYNDGGIFYGYGPNDPAPTRYCLSETSSNSKGYCPNGRRHFNSIYDKYAKEFDLPYFRVKEPTILRKAPKPTGVRCRIIHTVQDGETLKITNKRGAITKWLKDLWVGDTIAVCK